MNKKPRCPYCNAEMYPNETLGGQRFYSCRICGASSPRRSGAKAAYKAALDRIPAAPQPMSAVEYERTLDRQLKWCAARPCYKCESFDACGRVYIETPEYKVALVEKWAQEHPEKEE